MGQWRRTGALVALAATMMVTDASRADEPTAEDRERARALLLDGRAKLQAGDAAEAVRMLRAAHAIMNVPTTGLALARGLKALNQLMEARTLALEVSRMPAQPSEPPAFTKARAEAATLAEELSSQIPALVIQVNGRPADAAQVMVDGTPVPAVALGLPWKVNPGEHIVAATAAGFRPERRIVTVQEKEMLPVDLSLTRQVTASESAAPPTARASLSPASHDTMSQGSPGVPSWAWISGGAGLVALGVGVVFAVDYARVRGTAAEDCPGGWCDSEHYSSAEADALEARWNRDLGLAVGLGSLGLAGLGLATYGIVTRYQAKPSDARSAVQGDIAVVPWIGDGAGAVVRGAF